MENIKHKVEISGMSKDYEENCQEMLQDGYEYLRAHPESNLAGSKPKIKTENLEIDTFGVFSPETEDTEQLSKVVVGAVESCSGAQHHAVMSHLLSINKYGIDEWIEKAKERDQLYNREV